MADKIIREAMAIEQEDAKSAGAIGYYARMLIQATMPHSKLEETEFTRSNGSVTISIQAPSRIGLPFGHYPRLLLSWITTEAVRTKSPNLVLGDSLTSFMEQLGLVPTGGRWGTITRLREHMMRLFCSTISWSYDGPSSSIDVGIRPVEVAQLWWDPVKPDQPTLWKSSIGLNHRFYEEIVTRPVPVDMRALKALAKERSPLAIDIYTWLSYRYSYLHNETTIPWPLLQFQFGGDYGRTVDFKRKFIQQLKVVRKLYPDARCDPSDHGLRLLPSWTHVPRKPISG